MIQKKGLAHRRSLWKSSPNSKLLSRNFRAPLCSSSFLYRSLKYIWTSSMNLSTYVSVRIFWKPTWDSRSTQSDIRTADWSDESHYLHWKEKSTLTTNTSSNSLSSLYLRLRALWVKELLPLLSCKKKAKKQTFNFKYVLIYMLLYSKYERNFNLKIFHQIVILKWWIVIH